MKTRDLAYALVDQLEYLGIDTVVHCSGARNAPIIRALQGTNIRVHNFFHENSAGFFALGLAKQGKRVAVSVTSGTSVAQLASSCIEAFHDNQFLVYITADRPRKYRFSGAAQSIDQTKLLREHCSLALDIESIEEFDKYTIPKDKPIHINLCLDEPLWWDDSLPRPTKQSAVFSFSEKDSPMVELSSYEISESLFVISRLAKDEIADVLEIFESQKCLVYLEANSGISRAQFPKGNTILNSDRMCKRLMDRSEIKNVIHIGGVPVLRMWRDLVDVKGIKVLSLGRGDHSGIPGVERIVTSSIKRSMQSLESYKADSSNSQSSQSILDNKFSDIKKYDQEKQIALSTLCEKYPESEAAIYKKISNEINDEDNLYLGNSMAIRHWDMLPYPPVNNYDCNRGANGIDGQVSTFLGGVRASVRKNVAVLGDLTFFYDLQGLWASKCIDTSNVTIVIMNNSGGKIFERSFPGNQFSSDHSYEFKRIAQLYSWNYQRNIEAGIPNDGPSIVECFPDKKQNDLFWKEYNSLWK